MKSYYQKKRTITLIVLHCSATRCNASYSVEQLARDHKSRGIRGIGYHFYVRKNGDIVETRDVCREGAHVRHHNKYSIGVCYEGGLDERGQPADTRTPEQKASLLQLLTQLHADYPNAIIVGHRDLSPDKDGDGIITRADWLKQCPCLSVYDEYPQFRPVAHG